jgi:hypothetical protein
MVAAEKFALCLQAVTDDATSTSLAFGRHGLDGALEAVKGHRSITHCDLKGLIVVVTASVAFGHRLASEVFALLKQQVFSPFGTTTLSLPCPGSYRRRPAQQLSLI